MSSPAVTVTVFSKPDEMCPQCRATKYWLRKRNIEFEYIDITVDEGALEKLKALGHLQAPVVELKDASGAQIDVWSGHKDTKLSQHFKK
ncbi:NrdH-like glutaredoxin [Gordonia phage SpeedDemon]|uniref:NrdH-like glutaredoxin n=1 Tax=Gordonia phage Bantam TaxID=1887641 RepID=A0A1B3AYF9_9CAUD|nr:glutaredoxin [Gordonia phage Bantam]AOE43774.1 NrdH-like glutaredoxin [Gordonia phage Bantam]QNL30536.1 NrdH-like glutaredoxin [Gordonia phage SpeedDemon]